MNKRFYITTAIDYVNGQPHLGHAYEKVIADVVARARRSLGEDVFFLTGLDEHGQKVQQAAQAEKKNPQEYCDALAADWQAFAKKLELTNDDFVRTTQPRHKEFVQATLAKLNAAGHFYKATYTGFYSTKEETFLTEKDRLPDGTFDPSYGEVIELKEDNYYFKLGAHQQWLIDIIEANPHFIAPAYRRNEVLGFLKNNTLEDLCISRPAARLNWGIPLPFDKDFVTYVWFDALVNYTSIAFAHKELELWPADIHVIGKDIVKFHAVYWPIMLKAMGLPLPKQILVHGWWQKDGAKISKSTGNVVDPITVINEWGLDAFRFYVLRELDIGPDGNWTDAGFRSRYQAELANGLGNLVSRLLTLAARSGLEVVADPVGEWKHDAAFALHRPHDEVLAGIWSHIDQLNRELEQEKPWLALREGAVPQLREQIAAWLGLLAGIAHQLEPFLPAASARILAHLATRPLRPVAPLFPRV